MKKAIVGAASLLQKWITDSDAIPAFTILRAGTAVILIVKNLAELPSLGILYGQDGVLPWSIGDYTTLSILPKLSVVAGAFWKLGISADATLAIVFVIYTFALVWMLIRVQDRLPVFIAWYLHLMFFGASFKSVYGLDCFANIVLFYCLVGPDGDWRSVSRDSTHRVCFSRYCKGPRRRGIHADLTAGESATTPRRSSLLCPGKLGLLEQSGVTKR